MSLSTGNAHHVQTPGHQVSGQLEFFDMTVASNGVATVVFERPPVNAVSLQVYEDIGNLADAIEESADIKAVVLTAPPDARAWCGGADLNDFVGITAERRQERYAYINARLPRFYHLTRPVIAAINAHAVGIGTVLAGTCDMRVVAAEATFSCPEIDYGLIAGGAGLFSWLKMPEGKVREILFTGRRFTPVELESTGFFNYIVPRDEVVARALEVADLIATKSLPVIQARKTCSNALEGKTWMDAYLDAQKVSKGLVEHDDARAGVQAFLRRPGQSDLGG
jgi:enoyl-CoA hydratase/carnithine racemase